MTADALCHAGAVPILRLRVVEKCGLVTAFSDQAVQRKG
jgi:hypothetical protein